MRAYLIFLATNLYMLTNYSSCFAATKNTSSDQIICQFKILEDKIEINTEFVGDSSGKTALNIGKNINFILRTITGIDHFDDGEDTKTLYYKPNAKISLTYEVDYQGIPHADTPTAVLRKHGEDFFTFNGAVFIPMTDLTKSYFSNKKNIVLKYYNTSGKPAKMITGNGDVIDLGSKAIFSAQELTLSFFILGKKPTLLDVSEFNNSQKLHIFHVGNEKLSEEFISNTKKIFQQQCDFFKCERYKKQMTKNNYIFFIDEPKMGKSFSIRNHKASVMDYNGTWTYQDIAYSIMWSFIQSNGISMNASGSLYHIFHDGFTYFLAMRLSSRLNLITPEQQVKTANACLQDAYRFPYALLHIINPPYDHDRRPGFDVYRGFLMGLDIDYMLYNLTDGKYHFEDLMQQMINKKCKKFKCNITTEDMINTFDDLVKQSKAINYKSNSKFKKSTRYFNTYLSGGAKLMMPPPTMLNGLAKLKYKKLPSVDLQFKEESLLKYTIIEPYGTAYNLGLRTGQKLLALRLMYGDSDKDRDKIKLKIQNEKGEILEIAYNAKSIKDVPQYSMVLD
mgnify:CR=1 FL=1